VVNLTDLLAEASFPVRGDTNSDLVLGLLAFIVLGFLMAFGALLAGWFVRPKLDHPEKAATYECGEPTFGSSWVQFDLRFYVVALVFVIFDVEIALFYPWAVVFGGGTLTETDPEVLAQVKVGALWDMLFFFSVLVVGFLYPGDTAIWIGYGPRPASTTRRYWTTSRWTMRRCWGRFKRIARRKERDECPGLKTDSRKG
jgi:NADH:ubiquinone oxidoreductase subunit 3 (subunit A)